MPKKNPDQSVRAATRGRPYLSQIFKKVKASVTLRPETHDWLVRNSIQVTGAVNVSDAIDRLVAERRERAPSKKAP